MPCSRRVAGEVTSSLLRSMTDMPSPLTTHVVTSADALRRLVSTASTIASASASEGAGPQSTQEGSE